MRPDRRLLVLVAALICGACTMPRSPSPEAVTTPPPTLTPTPTPTVTVAGTTSPPRAERSALAELPIDDGPPAPGYLRDLFPTWKDIDHDGCDARRQALIAASTTPARTGERCAVISGTWISPYDDVTSTVPTDLQIDHVVPLADAWRSGAFAWTAEQRTEFANDQTELWVVSARSNQSKGDHGPEDWRPPNRSIWCRYAQRWLAIKLRWRLSGTTPERDALGQMLDGCPPG